MFLYKGFLLRSSYSYRHPHCKKGPSDPTCYLLYPQSSTSCIQHSLPSTPFLSELQNGFVSMSVVKIDIPLTDMYSNILFLPFRRTHPVSLSASIRQYISTKYDQHPDMFTRDMEAIDKLRVDAVNSLEAHTSGTRKLTAYAAQLVWIGGKFPIDVSKVQRTTTCAGIEGR